MSLLPGTLKWLSLTAPPPVFAVVAGAWLFWRFVENEKTGARLEERYFHPRPTPSKKAVAEPLIQTLPSVDLASKPTLPTAIPVATKPQAPQSRLGLVMLRRVIEENVELRKKIQGLHVSSPTQSATTDVVAKS